MYILQPLLLLLVVALWSPSIVTGAWWDPLLTGKSSCSQPGYFVNPSDCSKFYRCADHSTPERHVLVRYDFDCPYGTVFDQNVKVCVYPGASGCPSGWSAPPPPSGWSPPKEGWGWSPPKGIWISTGGGWAPSGAWVQVPPHGWSHPAEGWGPPGHNYWSFTPGSSYVVIYDSHGKKRSVKYDDIKQQEPQWNV